MTINWRKYFKGDPIIWIVIIVLSLFSILTVYSATGMLAYRFQEGNTTYYIVKHLFYLLIGFTVMFFVHHIPYRYFSRMSQLLLYLSIPLLLLTLILGTRLNEASRWLTLPVIGITIQTSDLAKLAIVMYVARHLSLRQDRIKEFRYGFVPVIVPVCIVALLIFPANFSTAAMVFTACMFLLFIGRIKTSHLLLFALTGIIAAGIFIGVALSLNKEGRIHTWKARVENFVSGESEENYQVEQSKIAIATGGILGKGPGNSNQRNYLPHPYSDFIFAIIIEEYGMLGGIVIVFLYLFLLYRAGHIVQRSPRTFPAFVSIGLVLLLVFQALINMMVAVNLIPVTGQTLPLVSMGGSSQLFTAIALGIVLGVSREINETEKLPLTEDIQHAEQPA